MRTVLFKAVPFVKEEVTLALESGVDGLLVPAAQVASAASLARTQVIAWEDVADITLNSKEDEADAAEALDAGRLVVLRQGWEIIPVENLLAHVQVKGRGAKPAPHFGSSSGTQALAGLALEAATPEEAHLAIGILETGVDMVVVPPAGVGYIKELVASLKSNTPTLPLCEARITEVRPVGMGHRVCVDTLSVFTKGQGMLVGNSAAFTFLVNAETEANEYVASRPFRINAGAVHAYAVMPGDATTYLEEVRAGTEVLVVSHSGETQVAVVGRAKVEKRPMLLLRAQCGEAEGAVFLQNAETIRLVTPQGEAVSVVNLKVGDTVLCRTDVAGRHFGMRIAEDIAEV